MVPPCIRSHRMKPAEPLDVLYGEEQLRARVWPRANGMSRSGMRFLPLLLAGCASLSTMQTASVTPEGAVRGSVNVGMPFGNSPQVNDVTWHLGQATGALEAGARYGLGGGLDVGAKLWFVGGRLDLKKELIDEGRSILSIGLGAGYFPIGPTGPGDDFTMPSAPTRHLVSGYLPVLYGLRLGEHELVLGATASAYELFGPLHGGLLVGTASAGIALRLGEHLRLMPEIGVSRQLTAWRDGDQFLFKDTEIYAAIGLLFGG
jgi:hypothetical protein